jgi:hypothetical protein
MSVMCNHDSKIRLLLLFIELKIVLTLYRNYKVISRRRRRLNIGRNTVNAKRARLARYEELSMELEARFSQFRDRFRVQRVRESSVKHKARLDYMRPDNHKFLQICFIAYPDNTHAEPAWIASIYIYIFVNKVRIVKFNV